jgi:hypothetical protein
MAVGRAGAAADAGHRISRAAGHLRLSSRRFARASEEPATASHNLLTWYGLLPALYIERTDRNPLLQRHRFRTIQDYPKDPAGPSVLRVKPA